MGTENENPKVTVEVRATPRTIDQLGGVQRNGQWYLDTTEALMRLLTRAYEVTAERDLTEDVLIPLGSSTTVVIQLEME
jgi:hypothetical protein